MSEIVPVEQSEQVDLEKLTPEQRVWRRILISNCINRLHRRSNCALSKIDYYFINLDGCELARGLVTKTEHRLKNNAQLLLDAITRLSDEENFNRHYNNPAEMLEAQILIINSLPELLLNIGGSVSPEEINQKNPNLDSDNFELDIRRM